MELWRRQELGSGGWKMIAKGGWIGRGRRCMTGLVALENRLVIAHRYHSPLRDPLNPLPPVLSNPS